MTIVSPNKSKRKQKIDTITIHCMACNATAVSLGYHFEKKSTKASSNYGIDSMGVIACYVPEEYRSWATSNAANDQRAITIEVANDGGAETGWHASPAALNALVDLLVDICERNGIPELRWKADKSLIGHIDKQNMTVHRWFANKACVPTYSEVLTRNGWVKISDIEIGDEIACADIDNLRITFEEVYDKVPVREQDTYTCNEFTATMDHRMVYRYHNEEWRITSLKHILNADRNAYIPLAGYYNGHGMNMTDDMIRLLVAVQADGHYIYETCKFGEKRHYGLEFHLKKPRKIERIKSILESVRLDYTECNKSDGSVSIRVYNNSDIDIVRDICEKYLCKKRFTWDWIDMSPRQASLFLDEIKLWDGCESANLYSSNDVENLDIVNAIAAINGVGSRVIGTNIKFRETPFNTIGGNIESKRNCKQKKSRKTEVTCVSVKTGIFLVRQDGKTFIIGNCPGDYLFNLHGSIAAEVNARLNGYPDTPVTMEVAKPTIKKGAKGENVRLLQKNLNVFGCGLKEDGSFGPASVAALKAWQTKYGLDADGSYGPKSYKKMLSLLQ